METMLPSVLETLSRDPHTQRSVLQLLGLRGRFSVPQGSSLKI